MVVYCLLYTNNFEKSINDIMIETGHGIPYDGGKK